MRTRHRLRTRLIISFAVFGLCLSVLFAITAMYVRAKVEDQLVINALQNDVSQAVDKALNGEPPSSELVEGWFKSERTLYKMPLAWQDLDNGVHDIYDTDDQDQKKHYKLAVKRKDGIIGFVRYDVSRDELGKQQLLVGLILVVILFGFLSIGIGVWLSARVLKPVIDLAKRLRHLQALDRAEPLAPHYAHDEVGQLAEALDDYALRLTQMVHQDREFNSDVSHELRTPLAVIASTTELLQASPDLTDKLRERLQRIERAGRQATEMIEALLLLSRAERRGPTTGEMTDGNKIVQDVIESQEPQLKRRPVSLKLETLGAPQVNAPSSVLSVILTNLIGNAIKYTREGEVIVTVTDRAIRIADTGPGIDTSSDENLFERGVRGKDAPEGSGAGLGLAIVKRLCNLYRWEVSLEPRQDVTGAIATLRFNQSI